MRTIALGIWALLATSGALADTLENRIADLEARLDAMESAVEAKLGRCTLHYRHRAFRLNRCDRGTFARAVTDVGGGAKQLECGYYRLICSPRPD